MTVSKKVYEGKVFSIEFYIDGQGLCPAEEWLEFQPVKMQQKFAALFAVLGDVGKIFNEQKFKHLTGTEQIFEFKTNQGRVFCFFFTGKRVILTHGFHKKRDKTPKGEIVRAEKARVDFINRNKL